MTCGSCVRCLTPRPLQAYNELRKSAHLVLNLLRLMQGCSIRDLQVGFERTH